MLVIFNDNVALKITQNIQNQKEASPSYILHPTNRGYSDTLLVMQNKFRKLSIAFPNICRNKDRITSKQYIDETIGVKVLYDEIIVLTTKIGSIFLSPVL